jgi:molybdate transport system ATP-binding protein
VQTGTIAEVTAHPRSRYVAELVGTNLVSGIVVAGTLTTRSGARVVVADAPAGRSFAVIRPQAVVLSATDTTTSSARNSWHGVVGDIDIIGDRARVSIVGELPLIAEVTVAAVDALRLRPGDDVCATVKATDIETYPA